MFLHLGGDCVIKSKDIVAILDTTSALKSKDSSAFLKTCEEEGFVKDISNDEVRSFIIVEWIEKTNRLEKGTHKIVVYKSSISALTLQKRAGFINTFPT